MPTPEDQVMTWVRKHPGDFRTHDVVEATGLGTSTVSSVLKREMGRDSRLTKPSNVRGRWRYIGTVHPAPQLDVGTLLECIGYDPDGKAVVSDEKGRMYIAEPTGITLVRTQG